MKRVIIIAVILAVLGLIGYFVYKAMQTKRTSEQNEDTTPSVSPQIALEGEDLEQVAKL